LGIGVSGVCATIGGILRVVGMKIDIFIAFLPFVKLSLFFVGSGFPTCRDETWFQFFWGDGSNGWNTRGSWRSPDRNAGEIKCYAEDLNVCWSAKNKDQCNFINPILFTNKIRIQ